MFETMEIQCIPLKEEKNGPPKIEHHQITISAPCQSHNADKLDYSIQQ